MMYYIIMLDPNANSTSLKMKIQELGNYFKIYENQYIVCGDYGNAKLLYERLVPNGEPQVGLVIFSVSVNSLKFWGYSDKELWIFLGKHSEKNVVL